jgi:hypothetical protein
LLALILKTLHGLAAFWLIAGLVGRYAAPAKTERSDDIRAVCAIMPVAGVFEKSMVIPGSMAVLVAGLLTAWTAGGRYWALTTAGGSTGYWSR